MHLRAFIIAKMALSKSPISDFAYIGYLNEIYGKYNLQA
jgi:hypothetical protein